MEAKTGSWTRGLGDVRGGLRRQMAGRSPAETEQRDEEQDGGASEFGQAEAEVLGGWPADGD